MTFLSVCVRLGNGHVGTKMRHCAEVIFLGSLNVMFDFSLTDSWFRKLSFRNWEIEVLAFFPKEMLKSWAWVCSERLKTNLTDGTVCRRVPVFPESHKGREGEDLKDGGTAGRDLRELWHLVFLTAWAHGGWRGRQNVQRTSYIVF